MRSKPFEAAGLKVVPGLLPAASMHARPSSSFFVGPDGRPTVDAVVNLTGFSLVGGPAYSDAQSAREILGKLDLPYLAAHAIEFQTIEDWAHRAQGLLPLEATMMVAMPELDGSTRSKRVRRTRGQFRVRAAPACDRNCPRPASEKAKPIAGLPPNAPRRWPRAP